MSSVEVSSYPVQCDIQPRQADLGRDGTASTTALAQWLLEARRRLRLPRFERLVHSGAFGPFQIVLVGERAERLGPVRLSDPDITVHTGIRRFGRSSFTYEQAVFAGTEQVGRGGATILLLGPAGPLTLPDEMIADLTELSLPDSTEPAPARPAVERRSRGHYSFFAPLRARIADVDINQHVNAIVLATWYDEAVAAFTAAALGVPGLVPDLAPTAHRIDYIGEVTYPGDYEIGVAVGSFEADTVHYELGIFGGDTCLGVADLTGPRGELTPAPSATDVPR
ncbi:hypothetical protein [Nocardia brasiliensis]|uniref:hypothetical protein n=1 Tax=Nocardia brasiliensis TaxID=37326 RepID=UPI002455799E|nr:hypothetical protein [Nocardia brasiliensis]